YKNLNNDLEEQASFQLYFDIDLDSFNKNILTDITTKEKNLHVVDLVVNAISDSDEYIYDNSIIIDEINKPSTININIDIASEICETSDSSTDEVEQKYARLHQAQRILNESKTFHNPQRFLNNMKSKLNPLEKFVEDILNHENRHTLPRTWKD
ncbi:25179_t:CDS:2, partial [Racocetra persica]